MCVRERENATEKRERERQDEGEKSRYNTAKARVWPQLRVKVLTVFPFARECTVAAWVLLNRAGFVRGGQIVTATFNYDPQGVDSAFWGVLRESQGQNLSLSLSV